MKFTIINYYYLATPLFWFAEEILDTNVRVTIPSEWGISELTYLAVCFVLGSFVFKGELKGGLFGLAESSINITLLILSVMVPATGALAQGPDSDFVFGMPQLANFMITGSVLLYCFYTNPLVNGKRKDPAKRQRRNNSMLK